MMPNNQYGYGQNLTIATLNALAGKNKETVKNCLINVSKLVLDKNDQPSEEFIELLASIAMNGPYELNKAMIKEYYALCCIVGINPEKSTVFRDRFININLPAMIEELKLKATDLSYRASGAKHKDLGTVGDEQEGL